MGHKVAYMAYMAYMAYIGYKVAYKVAYMGYIRYISFFHKNPYKGKKGDLTCMNRGIKNE